MLASYQWEQLVHTNSHSLNGGKLTQAAHIYLWRVGLILERKSLPRKLVTGSAKRVGDANVLAELQIVAINDFLPDDQWVLD